MENPWVEAHRLALNTVPTSGTILRPYNAEYVTVNVEMKAGVAPFLYVNAFVPPEVGAPTEWFVREQQAGMKCIFLSRAREQALKRCKPEEIKVKALRVVRKSETGQSLLVEVLEW